MLLEPASGLVVGIDADVPLSLGQLLDAAPAPVLLRHRTNVTKRETIAVVVRSVATEEHVVAHPTPLSPVGLVFETRVNAFALSAFKDGLFEVMDEGSQLVAELVAPPPG